MSFRVTLSPGGKSFDVDGHQTVLEAGLAAGLRLPYGCREGNCSSCRGKLLEGAVDFGRVHPTYLTNEHKAAGVALLCRARPLSDIVVEIEELPPISPPRALRAIVRALEPRAEDVMALSLRLPLHSNMRFAAGQYIQIRLPDGAIREYSIANASKPEGVIDLELHIRRLQGGAFTDHVFTAMKPRDVLTIEGPLGSFYLRESDKPAILLASGTGYAPIRSLVETMRLTGTLRPIALYWGGRRRRDLYAFDEAEEWARTLPDFKFVPVLSEADESDSWAGRTGLVHHAVMNDFADLSGHQVYACGAPVMVQAARADFVRDRALPDHAFFADAFLTQAEFAKTAAV